MGLSLSWHGTRSSWLEGEGWVCTEAFLRSSLWAKEGFALLRFHDCTCKLWALILLFVSSYLFVSLSFPPLFVLVSLLPHQVYQLHSPFLRCDKSNKDVNIISKFSITSWLINHTTFSRFMYRLMIRTRPQTIKWIDQMKHSL